MHIFGLFLIKLVAVPTANNKRLMCNRTGFAIDHVVRK